MGPYPTTALKEHFHSLQDQSHGCGSLCLASGYVLYALNALGCNFHLPSSPRLLSSDCYMQYDRRLIRTITAYLGNIAEGQKHMQLIQDLALSAWVLFLIASLPLFFFFCSCLFVFSLCLAPRVSHSVVWLQVQPGLPMTGFCLSLGRLTNGGPCSEFVTYPASEQLKSSANPASSASPASPGLFVQVPAPRHTTPARTLGP